MGTTEVPPPVAINYLEVHREEKDPPLPVYRSLGSEASEALLCPAPRWVTGCWQTLSVLFRFTLLLPWLLPSFFLKGDDLEVPLWQNNRECLSLRIWTS